MIERKLAPQALEDTGSAIITCNGNSMRSLIAPKEAIHLRKVDPSLLRVGDAALARIRGALQVHKILAIDIKNQRVEFGNNRGFSNGFVDVSRVYGLCVQVEDRVIVSNEELINRQKELE